MRNRIRWNAFRSLLKANWLIAFFLLCCNLSLGAEQSSFNVLCRPELALSHRAELAGKLRLITGWQNLGFDENGALRLNEMKVRGGSQTARDLLRSAVSGKSVIVMEDASNRSDVVFCRVIEGKWKRNAVTKPPVYILLIDFADFSHLTGDAAALAAFDVGWGVMHELDHVVRDSLDAEKNGETGECENNINRMRRECGLPLRADYYFSFLPATAHSDFKTKLVRLPFNAYNAETNKMKRYWLVWDARIVGGLDEQKRLAARL